MGLVAAIEGRQRAYVPIGRGRELWELCGPTAFFVKWQSEQNRVDLSR